MLLCFVNDGKWLETIQGELYARKELRRFLVDPFHSGLLLYLVAGVDWQNFWPRQSLTKLAHEFKKA